MAKQIDVALIGTSLVNLGIRSLKASLKEIGISPQLYILNTRNLTYTDSEIKHVITALKDQDPKIIGLSCIEYSAIKAKQLIKSIKSSDLLRNKILIVGGVHPSICPEEYIDLVDIVLIGEGERVFIELTESILNNKDYSSISNLWVRNGEKIIKNKKGPLIEDLDILPLPDYSSGVNMLVSGRLVKSKKEDLSGRYTHLKKKAVFLFGVRGCPKRCSYCINSRYDSYQWKIRKVSINKIVEYLQILKRNLKELDFIFFIEDDFFRRNQDEIEEFSLMYKRKINLPFFMNCSPETVSDIKLNILVKAGLKILNMGIQSGSESVNKIIFNRNIDSAEIIRAGGIIHEYSSKVYPMYDVIVSNPYERHEDLLGGINLIQKIPKPFMLHIHYLVFYKGTVLYDKAVKDGLIDENYLESGYDLHVLKQHLKKNENYYLNSLISWMEGRHTAWRRGYIPAFFLKVLIMKKCCVFFKMFPNLVFFINIVLDRVCKRKS
ncbi:MAG: B12-binding domain-containing radical SAM protein [Candidatus Omnitrophica bacterium]|nr:B12-binding domain-containing radical SAM protein [Candidatus Omnitrophota bacterium]